MDEELKRWKEGGPFIHNDRVVEILYYVYGSGVSGLDVEIYLKDGSSIQTDMTKLPKIMKQWHPIHEQAVILAREEAKKGSVLNQDVVGELRETILDQIRKLKDNPSKEAIEQSKALNATITTFTNLAKTELDFRRFHASQNRRLQ